MSQQLFSTILRGETDAIWKAVREHPFVRGLGAGDLSKDRYQFYLEQDYLYLIEFGRVFALASARADSLGEMAYFAKLLNLTLETEMDLHRRTCADFGVGAEALEAVEPAMITTAYTNLLVRTCYEGRMADIIAVLLPCAGGYVEAAQYLRAKGLPKDRHYRDWIETYASSEFADYAAWLQNQLDTTAEGAAQTDHERWRRLYATSARFELLFFDMGWKKELWPPEVPGSSSVPPL